ncbi:MAG: CapA family protein [Oscillospiraceae bacterium]
MKLTIGADLVPTQSNIASFEQGDARQLVGDELLSLLAGADFRLFNLEVPLTDRLSPIPKCGPHLSAPERTAAGIVSIGADLCTLANNHIMDQGAQGLRRTLELLREKKVRTVGAGETLAQALQPVFLEKDGQKVGVYACAEHEFSIAGENQPGANPFDPYESFDHVAALRAQCDYLIVLYHGGKEHYRYPSPGLQKTCRKLVEKGADLVVCQHSHCIGCEEDYGNGKIVYGQGNFLFDHSEREFWQTSLLILVDTQQKQQVRYVPLRKQGRTVRLAEQQDAAEILEQFLAIVRNRRSRLCETAIPEFCAGDARQLLWRLEREHLFHQGAQPPQRAPVSTGALFGGEFAGAAQLCGVRGAQRAGPGGL